MPQAIKTHWLITAQLLTALVLLALLTLQGCAKNLGPEAIVNVHQVFVEEHGRYLLLIDTPDGGRFREIRVTPQASKVGGEIISPDSDPRVFWDVPEEQSQWVYIDHRTYTSGDSAVTL